MKQSRILLFFAVAFFASGIVTAIAKPINIVLIVADDLGYGDLGCYGSQVNGTPHIDALASGGQRWTDFHSAGPMCSPTRAAMLTGKYQQRLGKHFDSALSGIEHRDIGLPTLTTTMAEVLRQAGYRTGCFGKWHLGYRPPHLPPSHGFDEFVGIGSGDGDFHTHVDRSGNPDWWRNERLQSESGYTTDLLTKHSVEFIETHRDRPFFLYVPHLAIHFPWQGPKDPPHRQVGKNYHKDKWGIISNPGDVSPHVQAMIESLDQSVGATIDALRKWDLIDNTLVIFTSDNGGYLDYAGRFHQISSNGPLRGQKTELYEGGHRVPMIFFWPGKIAPGETTTIGHSCDLLPTIARMAGIPPSHFATDGIDLTPVLRKSGTLPKRSIFWRAHKDRAVREGRWKLVMRGRRVELYDLETDLDESDNLADAQPQRVAAMRDAWRAWQQDVDPEN